MIQISQLTTEQLPHALMLAMQHKTTPTIDWKLCGNILEREKISLVFFGTHWVAMEINPLGNHTKATQKSVSALDAVIKCYIQIKLGDIIDLETNQ
ncbi:MULTISPECIES: phage protein NinX family protein [Acinetobacter]|uniref:DUF2591 domain-containing protein n=2 Tax=Acinetobacter TaxID=469 RepID=N8ZYE1_ACIVR|nr:MULTISPECIES: phage protein NinX family protein [Acinetobacter]ENV36813.1 hypothetical protein F959_02364 [Acinetobacter venetianus RAG-1 = CIP 110063]ENX04004.1 hypothetical protein F900_00495 [Acinetobacter modestus]MBC9227786.1 DUF2591 family protein [Acinetobacter baumannii]